MRKQTLAVCLMAGLALSAGCKKNAVDQSAFKSAINNYLSARQECVWNAPIKFPAQATTSDEDQTKGFDALTDAGLLTRKSAEKKRFLVGSKQVNDYDLSDKGRSKWTADTSQPGYGNFCYGHPQVTSIDSYTPQTSDSANYTVAYHYDVSSLPDWANTAEMKTAFARLAAATSPQPGSANLSKSNNGWVVESATPGSNAATDTSPAQ
jgi:hypothetical protein